MVVWGIGQWVGVWGIGLWEEDRRVGVRIKTYIQESDLRS